MQLAMMTELQTQQPDKTIAVAIQRCECKPLHDTRPHLTVLCLCKNTLTFMCVG